MILVKHCRTLPRMLQTEIYMYVVHLCECSQEVIKIKKILSQRKQNFVALNLQATVFIFRQVQIAIILSCK